MKLLSRVKYTILIGCCLLSLTGCLSSGGSSSSDVQDRSPTAADISTLALSASASSITSSISSVILTATATDENGVVIPGVDVAFAATSGSLSSGSETTDDSGRAVVSFVSADLTSRDVIITATVGTLIQTTAIAISAISSVSVESVAVADSTNFTITTTVLDSLGSPVTGVEVDLSASSGSLTAADTITDSAGQLLATLAPDAPVGETVTVTATVGTQTSQVIVDLSATDSTFTASAASTAVVGEELVVTFSLVDDAGSPLVDEEIIVTSALGNALDDSSPTTDTTGSATVTVTLANNGSETISATALGASKTASAAVTILQVASVTLTASDTNLLSHGNSPVTLTATVLDSNSNPMTNIAVDLTTTGGVLTLNSSVTDANGQLTGSIVPSGLGNATLTVTASIGALSSPVTINVTGTSLTAVANSAAVIGDIVPIVYTLLDANADPVVGQILSVSSSSNTVDISNPITDSNGQAAVNVRITSGPLETVTATAFSGTITRSTDINIAVASSIELRPATANLGSDGSNPATLTAIVKDADGIAIQGVAVVFSSDSGTLTVANNVSDALGVVTATLVPSGFANEVIPVQANTSGVTEATSTITVTGTTLAVTADSSTLLGNTVPITVTLTDLSGAAISGETVTFSAVTLVGNSYDVSTVTTDTNGQATINLSANTAGTETITATAYASNAFSGSVVGTANIDINTISPIDLIVSSTLLGSSGSSPLTITATLTDSANSPLASVPVTITATDPLDSSSSQGSLTVNSTVTDTSGVVTATLSPSGFQNRNIRITATAAGQSNFVDVSVQGTTLTSTSTFSAVEGDNVAVIFTLLDSDSNPIANEDLAIVFVAAPTGATPNTTDLPVSNVVTTNTSGQATVNLTAANSGTDTITATAFSDVTTATSSVVTTTADRFVIEQVDDVVGAGTVITTSINLSDAGLLRFTWLDEVAAPQVAKSITFSTTRGEFATTSFTSADGSAGNDFLTTPETVDMTIDGGTIYRLTFNEDHSGDADFQDDDAIASITNALADAQNLTTLATQDITALVTIVNDAVNDTDYSLSSAASGIGLSFSNIGANITTDHGITRGSSIITLVTDGAGQIEDGIHSTTAGVSTITAVETSPAVGEVAKTTTLDVNFIADTTVDPIVSAAPSVLATGETSVIRALVRDADSNPAEDQSISFTLSDSGGGSLSPAVVSTNSSGIAQTTYTAGSDTAVDGVVVTATVASNLRTGSANLTVAEKEVLVSMGTGSAIVSDTTSYTIEYDVFVNTLTGDAVVGATVDVVATPLQYIKGRRVEQDEFGQNKYDNTNVINPLYSGTFTQWVTDPTATCVSEDTNENGLLDLPGEDTNGDGILTPGGVAAIVSEAVTDSSGRATVSITYPQSNAEWVTMTLNATVVSDGGVPSTTSQAIALPLLSTDLDEEIVDPPGKISPFGTSAVCTDAL